MDEEDQSKQELYEALIENKALTKELKQGLLSLELIKFITIFIGVCVIVIVIKLIWGL